MGNLIRVVELTAEQERELLRRALNGDRLAEDVLVRSLIRLAQSLAKKWEQWASLKGLPLEELIQEALIGALRAIRKWNPSRRNRLSTYATYWMRAMIRAKFLRWRILLQEEQDWPEDPASPSISDRIMNQVPAAREPDPGSRELPAELTSALDRLPRLRRQAVHVYLGLTGGDGCESYSELAGKLGCTPFAARKRYERGIEQLRSLVSGRLNRDDG